MKKPHEDRKVEVALAKTILPPVPVEETRELTDQEKRENIPDPATFKSLARPARNLLLVKMLPEIKSINNIIIPENSSIRIQACEGHVLFRGPDAKHYNTGDCVTFEKNLAIGIEIDEERGDYFLVPEGAVILVMKADALMEAKTKRESASPR